MKCQGFLSPGRIFDGIYYICIISFSGRRDVGVPRAACGPPMRINYTGSLVIFLSRSLAVCVISRSLSIQQFVGDIIVEEKTPPPSRNSF